MFSKYNQVQTRLSVGLSRWFRGKESTCQCRISGFDLWVRKISWSRKHQPTLLFLPGKSHRQRSLVGNSPEGRKESDMTKYADYLYTTLTF